MRTKTTGSKTKSSDGDTLKILKEDIKTKNIRKLYLFYGPEEYLKKYYMGAIESAIIKEELKSLNRILIEGKADLGKVIDNCETLPVFSDRKLVIVKNSGLFKAGSKKDSSGGKEKESKKRGKNDEFLDYLQSIPASTCLLFYEEAADKNLKIFKEIKKQGLTVEFPYQGTQELIRWINNVLKSRGKTIDPQGAAMLAENCDQGMDGLMNEIEKLVQYAGSNSNISLGDTEKLSVKSIKGRIFDLTDAITEKNTKKALMLLEDMIILKEPVAKILFMIIKHFRQMLEMKLYSIEGFGAGEISSKMGLHPYVAGKMGKHAAAFTAEELKQALNDCLRYDVDIKTGRINDRVAVEMFIAKYSKSNLKN